MAKQEPNIADLVAEIAALRQQVINLQSGMADNMPVTRVEEFNGTTVRRIASMEMVKGAKSLTFHDVEESGGFLVHTYCGSTRVPNQAALDRLNIEGKIEYVR